LLVAERQYAQARGLRPAREIRDRNARQAVDGIEAVQLERVDDQLDTVGHCCFRIGRSDLRLDGTHEELSWKEAKMIVSRPGE